MLTWNTGMKQGDLCQVCFVFYAFELLSAFTNHKIPVMPCHCDPAHIYWAISHGKDIHWWVGTWITASWTSTQPSAEPWWHQYPSRYCRLRLLIWSRRNVYSFLAGNCWTDFQHCSSHYCPPFPLVKNVSGVQLFLGEIMWSSIKGQVHSLAK